jgi:hypothetical protein
MIIFEALSSIGFDIKVTEGRVVTVSRRLNKTLFYNSTIGFIDIGTAVKTGYAEINYLCWEPSGKFWFSEYDTFPFDQDYDVLTTFEYVFENILTKDEQEASVWHLDILR